MDVAVIQERTGWTLHHHVEVASTNDVAVRLVNGGAPARTAVVADAQSAGRGRKGRAFASPPGGLYASLLVDAEPAERPGVVVALAGVAAAEAIEAVAGRLVALKWPNDLLMDGRKVGGILLETTDAARPVVVGIGVNLDAVPSELNPDVRAQATAVGPTAGRPVARDALLVALLRAVDGWTGRRVADGFRERLERAWRGRLALIGEAVDFECAGRSLRGVLEDASLSAGLLVRDAVSGPVWRPAEHVQDLRRAGRTIP
jgi:BirA family biotin operon repressor/biotin-[acetyl-CoA-carboxylase] ligase